MSTPAWQAPGTPGGAPPLFAALIDDAAVFPPGNATLATALAQHGVWQTGPVGPYLGPLLCRADQVAELPHATPFPVGVIARAADPRGLAEVIASRPDLRIVDAEIPLGDRPPAALLQELRPAPGLGIAVELDRARAASQLAQFTEIPAPVLSHVRAKYRTGGTTRGSVPSAAELAAVIGAAARRRVPIKFTAGLHHAVPTRADTGDLQHGLLNVLAAIHAAIGGAADADLADLLMLTDPETPARLITALGADDIAAVRGIFTSFGCCGVTEPLGELARLGIVESTEDR